MGPETWSAPRWLGQPTVLLGILQVLQAFQRIRWLSEGDRPVILASLGISLLVGGVSIAAGWGWIRGRRWAVFASLLAWSGLLFSSAIRMGTLLPSCVWDPRGAHIGPEFWDIPPEVLLDGASLMMALPSILVLRRLHPEGR